MTAILALIQTVAAIVMAALVSLVKTIVLSGAVLISLFFTAILIIILILR